MFLNNGFLRSNISISTTKRMSTSHANTWNCSSNSVNTWLSTSCLANLPISSFKIFSAELELSTRMYMPLPALAIS